MASNPLKKSFAFMKFHSDAIQEKYDSAASRTLHITGISGIGNTFLGLLKIVSGMLSLSVFVCVNGFYTLGMVLARYCALFGAMRARDRKSQFAYYRWSGRLLILASLAYVAYSAWTYFHPKEILVHMYAALAISALTFTEIGLNLYGVLIHRKSKSPLIHAIKTINLAASLISLVLTQAAILSFVQRGQHDPAVNAILGIITGTCAALLGYYMLRHIRGMEQTPDIRTGGGPIP